MKHNLRVIPFASLFMLVVFSTNVQAEEKILANPEFGKQNTSSQPPEDENWKFELGGGVMYGPKYDGSDNYEVKVLPAASVEYKNGLFFASIWDGIGSYFLQGENYKVGASIGYNFGREESDDKDNLRGMGDIDSGVAATLKAEYSFGPVDLSGEVSTGTEGYGTTAKIELGTMHHVTEQLMVMMSIGSTWADGKHMESYFGVSPVQSARSGYSRYEAESGFKSVGISVAAVYNISENWDVMLMVNADQLLGDAADSPITKEEFSVSTFSTVNYKFSL
jgi:outer membrane scaffolding protein for murein synthesis (MipA/OmpV family)